jgi:hypothetical protein
MRPIYLNCEDFKRHSFPNVLIEILRSIFREMHRNLTGWFGKKKRSREIMKVILDTLDNLQRQADEQDEDIRQILERGTEEKVAANASIGQGPVKIGFDASDAYSEKSAVERSFRLHKKKLEELDRWLPELKDKMRDFFYLSKSIKSIIIQVDDLYHLKRTDQAFIVDYIHRLCKDMPIYFKIATLRHVSTLYLDRDGQPTGIQERHDYQPINIDYTFSDFRKTAQANHKILVEFGRRAGMTSADIDALFRGEGFNRLVMAGGGVPRDILSLFLEILKDVDAENGERLARTRFGFSLRRILSGG